MERNVPQHIAIIMDGNGRWAKRRNLPRNEGHRRGAETLRKVIRHAQKRGIAYITVYAFSTENWSRPKEEVDGLMNLLRTYLKQNLRFAKKESLKFKIIGDIQGLDADLQAQIKKLEEDSSQNVGMQVNIAMNYGGRDEVIRAIRKMSENLLKGGLHIQEISEEVFESYLDTAQIPEPDLMIRTSGELRTSNFMPWQLAYSEFYFAECLWPDFDEKQFDLAIEAYMDRRRRFGKSE
jgi:undecaprenyl diphosphate synthase